MCSRTRTPSCPLLALPDGVVGASSIPPANATPAMRRYRRRVLDRVSRTAVPTDAETPVVLAFHDAMEGLLRGIEAADGDLSEDRQRLRGGARARASRPAVRTRALLDRNRQAVRTHVPEANRRRTRWQADGSNSFVSCQESSRRSADCCRARPRRAREASRVERQRHLPGRVRSAPIVQVKRVSTGARSEPSGAEASTDEQRRMMRRRGECGARVADPFAPPPVGQARRRRARRGVSRRRASRRRARRGAARRERRTRAGRRAMRWRGDDSRRRHAALVAAPAS